ncbi:hypothetical protein GCM10007920_44800 [Ciceribacter naphthalenivorans]|uniref:Uncharacterized protein n=2 Tax=Alphaproteobacteria TaxID=28211 RepID=A0A512HFK1_9HYPH|nr:hypothetical protein RNA01_10820 [Ciceribacter naphthalenivorans]GLR24686.1 hypothetical protein GCM10007920_44800 [Ciceribacter naphthalenivorans]GLT07542.1 hypothetical protein GCM10007926_44800 [Sphingomonas psychrolutea]
MSTFTAWIVASTSSLPASTLSGERKLAVARSTAIIIRMRVTFASIDGVRKVFKLGLRNVAKIARNNDIFGAIDDRKCGEVQARVARIEDYKRLLRIRPIWQTLLTSPVYRENLLARQYY